MGARVPQAAFQHQAVGGGRIVGGAVAAGDVADAGHAVAEAGARATELGGQVGGGVGGRGAGEQRGVVHLGIDEAHAIVQVQAVVQVPLQVGTELLDLVVDAVGQIQVAGQQAVAVEGRHRGPAQVVGQQGAVQRVEQRRQRLRWSARIVQRDRVVERGAVVEVLGVHVEDRIAHQEGQVAAHLAALVGGVAGVAQPIIAAVVAADAVQHVLAQRARTVGVLAAQTVAADGHAHRALGRGGAVAGDGVDRAARRVGREQRRGAAADHFQALGHHVQRKQRIDVEEAFLRLVEQGHAVFLVLHVVPAAGGQAAHVQVLAAALAAGGFGREAGHGAQHVDTAARCRAIQALLRHHADRERRVLLRLALRGAGDDDLIQGSGGIGSSGGLWRLLGIGCVGGKNGRQRQREQALVWMVGTHGTPH